MRIAVIIVTFIASAWLMRQPQTYALLDQPWLAFVKDKGVLLLGAYTALIYAMAAGSVRHRVKLDLSSMSARQFEQVAASMKMVATVETAAALKNLGDMRKVAAGALEMAGQARGASEAADKIRTRLEQVGKVAANVNVETILTAVQSLKTLQSAGDVPDVRPMLSALETQLDKVKDMNSEYEWEDLTAAIGDLATIQAKLEGLLAMRGRPA
jgi:hypothetical protein